MAGRLQVGGDLSALAEIAGAMAAKADAIRSALARTDYY